MTQNPLSAQPAFRPMDAVRGLCTTSIVALHAATPYVALDLEHLLWPVEERGAFGWADWLFWTVRCFSRGTLFLIAGFASMAILEKLGAREFLRRRATRLAVPLVAGAITVLPLMYQVWAWGWVRCGRATPSNILHIRFKHGIQPELYGFGHLWFLWYLLLVSVVVALVAMWLPRLRLSDRVCGWVVSTPLRTLAIAVPVAFVVRYSPEAIFDFRNGFIPRLDFLAYHLPFFFVGACMYRVRDRLAALTRWWWVELLLVGAVVPVLMRALAERAAGGTESQWLAAACIGVVGGLMSCGLIGWSASTVSPRGEVWRWLAARSFFIYFWHLPFVGLAHIALYQLAVPVVVKVAVSFALGVLGAAGVYRLLKGTRLMQYFGESGKAQG